MNIIVMRQCHARGRRHNHDFLHAIKIWAVSFAVGTMFVACDLFPKRIPLPESSPWVEFTWVTAAHFHVENLAVEPMNLKQARISGQVIDYTIELENGRARREWYYPLVAGRSRPADKPQQQLVQEVLSKERREPSSRKITIINPVGPDMTILVTPSNRFETIITPDERHFFQAPPRPSNPYLDVFSYNRALELTPQWSDPRVSETSKQTFKRDYEDYKGNVRQIPVWFYGMNEQAVKDYVNRSMPLVTFAVEDNDTRVPVHPNLQVVAINVPSKNQLLDRFRREFQDKDIANSAIARVPEYTASGTVPLLWGYDETGRSRPNWFSFRGVAGGTYRIESRHENYYYFEGMITLEKKASIDKTLLLVWLPVTVRLSEGRSPVRGRIVDR